MKEWTSSLLSCFSLVLSCFSYISSAEKRSIFTSLFYGVAILDFGSNQLFGFEQEFFSLRFAVVGDRIRDYTSFSFAQFHSSPSVS